MSEYVVETILVARVKQVRSGTKRDWEYLVKWSGYDDPKDHTWEPTHNFTGGSEHFISSFWAKITSRKQGDIGKYAIGTEVFPTGPPCKPKRSKVTAKPSSTPKTPSASTSEVVEDSEGEVRSIISDDLDIGSRKRRAPSPSQRSEEIPAKRTRRKSARAIEATSTSQKATRRASKSTPSNSKAPTSAQKRDGTLRRKPLLDSTPIEISPSTPSKINIKSRHPRVHNGSSVVSETSPSNDATSDVEEVQNLVVGDTNTLVLRTPTDSGTGQDRGTQVTGPSTSRLRTSSGFDWAKSQFPAHQQNTANTQNRSVSHRASPVPQTNGFGQSRQSTDESQEYLFSSHSRLQPLSTVAAAASSTVVSGAHRVNFLFYPGEAVQAMNRTILSLFSSRSSARDDAPRSSPTELSTRLNNLGEAQPSMLQPSAPPPSDDKLCPSVNVDSEAADPLPEYGDTDAEGEIDEELLVTSDFVLNEQPDVPERKEPIVSSPFSSAWTNTIFGPLGIGRDTKARSSSTFGNQEHICPVRLSYSVTLPLHLKDIESAPKHDDPSLGEVLVGLSSQAPGKFYNGQYALALMDALRFSGSRAICVLTQGAAQQDEDHFQRFKAKLTNDNIFVTMIGTHMLVLCSPASQAVQAKLSIPYGLSSDQADVLVAEVVIKDDAAYCEAAMYADEGQW